MAPLTQWDDLLTFIMDLKALVAVACVLVSGYLFYVNHQRDLAFQALNRKYQAALSGAPAVQSDAALMEVIRATVTKEIKSRPSSECGVKSSTGDLVRLQELQIRMDSLDKMFNQAMQVLMDPESALKQEDKIAAKANKIKEKILALCKK